MNVITDIDVAPKGRKENEENNEEREIGEVKEDINS